MCLMISYFQVLALVAYPALMDIPGIPDDVKERADTILKGCKGYSVGSYSEPTGLAVIRQHIADYIERRDGGVPSSPDDIMLTSGATTAITDLMNLLSCIVDNKKPGNGDQEGD